MVELPLHTERLVLRPFRLADVPALVAYRSDPEVARFQSWQAPYPHENGERLVRDQAHLAGPTPGEWIQIAAECAGALVGDVAVRLDDSGVIAEVGYTLASRHQGQGLATEMVAAIVDALLAAGVQRVEASVDPRNRASRRVLERLGFEREGCRRRRVRTEDGWADDELWAVLADERAAWRERSVAPPAHVRLVELDETSARAYERLRTHPTQVAFVATVAESFADALFPGTDDAGGPTVPWLRGIEADGEPAGFVMVAEATASNPEPMLWRLLVDRRHQGRGVGRLALGLVLDRLRADGHLALLTSWVPGAGTPEPFYRRLGFQPTGDVDDGEVVARLVL